MTVASNLTEAGQMKQYELMRAGFRLLLDISADGTTCTARYLPVAGGVVLTEAELTQFMAQCQITEGVIDSNLTILILAASERKSLAGALLAEGTTMMQGEPGWLEFSLADALDDGSSDADTLSGTVSFRKVQAFLNVNPGDKIGVIHRPGPGSSGKTVQGINIPATPGTSLMLQLGEFVSLGDDGQTVYAEAAGRVCHADGVLTIENTYTVKGDVDFKVGNIDFNGFVEITGDVLDGFSVKATKGLKIHGNADNCQLASDGDISLCGMNGGGAGMIRCGGDLTVNFCNDTIIVCDGSVLVEVEMRNCQVRCLGALLINKGTFGGGKCIALAGVESGALGTRTSMATVVMAGISYRDFDETEALNSQLVVLNDQFTAISADKRDLNTFIAARNRLTEQLQEVRNRSYDATNPKINVSRVVYENVRLLVGQAFELTNEDIQGPVSLIRNSRDGGLHHLAMSALTVPAVQLEQAIMLEQTLAKL
ncbi:MAG: DUF342 domain-containing protein [Deltaproteobacteria bacterium]|nr:DUF342 domain-containing protein [Deltaproteobacteria bacterium]